MGTDIHLWVEYKDDEDKWVEPDREMAERYEFTLSYSARCYQIFAILANVRNTFDIIPISDLRGVPEDYKELEGYKEYLEKVKKGHWSWGIVDTGTKFDACSYHTLTQLKEYDWDSVERQVTWIKDEEFYKHFIPALEKLAHMHGGSDNVRILFSFDS